VVVVFFEIEISMPKGEKAKALSLLSLPRMTWSIMMVTMSGSNF
jgi:hypothetical protein